MLQFLICDLTIYLLTYFDRYGGLQAEWERAKPIIYGIRKEWNDPRFRENFELLAKRGYEWLEKHPPRVDVEE
jgi:hypothetical protein